MGPVSADEASPAVVGSRSKQQAPAVTPVRVETDDPVRALQHTLYRAAKADPDRRFHALWDKVTRRDVLWRAWVLVRRNNGAPGIDAVTLAGIEESGVSRFLDELAADLKEGRYRPQPTRRVLIPKPGSTEQRPLSIPVVRDRVVQAACKIVLEPVFEADFLPCSFGFRPQRSAHDALQVVIDEAWRGRVWVVETDIANCFEAIPSEKLMQAVEERVCDQSVLKLLRAMLRAGVMVDGQVVTPQFGTPQGGPLSPLLCNVYLHRLDRVWQTREHGVLVRYCDDAVVMCKSRQQAEAALARLREIMAELGMQLKDAKTRIVHLEVGGEGLTFLGFGHRLVRSPARTGRRQVTFLARWPSDKAMRRARDRLRELTARSRFRIPVEEVVAEMNMFLRGWAAYFRYGNSADRFVDLSWYANQRLGLFLAKRYARGRRFGRWLVGVRQPANLRLVSLAGIAIPPRPNRPWRGRAEYRR